VSEGDAASFGSLSYTTLSADLRAANPFFFNASNLPAGSSVNGQSSFLISAAQERMFGLLPLAATPGTVDGIIGIGTAFSPGTVRIAGALHEIGHALGRIP
jgi:hypothetical protein